MRKTATEKTIRRIDFEIYSEDLTVRDKMELRQRMVLTLRPKLLLSSTDPVVFALNHRSHGHDQLHPTSVRELVSDLRKLGVETASLTVTVYDDVLHPYTAPPLHIPVYQLVRTVGHATLSDPRQATT